MPVGNMINYACPYCNREIETSLDYIEEDEWDVIVPRSCTDDDEMQCKGCISISQIETEVACERCGLTVRMYCKYSQPCNDNGHALAIRFERADIEPMDLERIRELLMALGIVNFEQLGERELRKVWGYCAQKKPTWMIQNVVDEIIRVASSVSYTESAPPLKQPQSPR